MPEDTGNLIIFSFRIAFQSSLLASREDSADYRLLAITDCTELEQEHEKLQDEMKMAESITHNTLG